MCSPPRASAPPRSSPPASRGWSAARSRCASMPGSVPRPPVARAQNLVRGLIKPLGGEAIKRWDAAKTVLVREFKSDRSRVEKEIAERHSGVGGAILSVVDWATGLPDWVTEDYNAAEKRFADGVIQNLLAISQDVETIIASCQKIIDETKEEVAGIFRALPGSLQEWASRSRPSSKAELDGLGKEVADARDSFNKQLSESASQAVDEVRSRDRRASQESWRPDRPDRRRGEALRRRSGEIHHRGAALSWSASRPPPSGRWSPRSRRSSRTSSTTRLASPTIC